MLLVMLWLHFPITFICNVFILYSCDTGIDLLHRWIIFQFIYAVSFPMYAYYCIAEPNASRVSFYKVDYAKEALVMVVGATLAGVSIAIGIYNSGFKL